MEKPDSAEPGFLPGYLLRASEDPERCPDLLRFTLEEIVASGWVTGTALVRPHTNIDRRNEHLRIVYEGAEKREMQSWVDDQVVSGSLESARQKLKEECEHLPGKIPEVFDLNPTSTSYGGLWVLWPSEHTDTGSIKVEAEPFQRRLESLLEFEYKERTVLRPEMATVWQDIQRGRDQALSSLLVLARQLSEADFTHWGVTRNGIVRVDEWTYGIQEQEFKFRIPIGEGLGGKAFDEMKPIRIADYKNSGYRHRSATDAADREGIRAIVAVPARGSTPGNGGVLYASRRKASPFSDVQCALLLRMLKSIEPIADSWPGPQRSFIQEKQSEYRRILESPTNIGEVETFVEEIIGGPAIAVNPVGVAYTRDKVNKLDKLLNSREEKAPRKTVPIPGSQGELYLWPKVKLPLDNWPDFLEYAASLCSVVLETRKPVQSYLMYRRRRWVERLLEGQSTPEKVEGRRLGLQGLTDRGEVWAVAWEEGTFGGPGEEDLEKKDQLKRLAEDVVWEELDVGLAFLEDEIWLLLLGEQAKGKLSPSSFRDKLYSSLEKYIQRDGALLWLVHGAYYDSSGERKDSLKRALDAAKDARQKRDERYVRDIAEVDRPDIDILLDNPRHSAALNNFADKILEPLLVREAKNSSEPLTRTLCYTLLLEATAAEIGDLLKISRNTIPRRVHQAEEILERKLSIPKDKAALSLAAYIWLRRNDPDVLKKAL